MKKIQQRSKNNKMYVGKRLENCKYRSIKISPGRILKATPVFDTYWKFAKKRQDIFISRLKNTTPPWTKDPILSSYRFTNVYRASDRVSQYLIQNVIYKGSQSVEEIFFRVLLFKIFNYIPTWKLLVSQIGIPKWKNFKFSLYSKILDVAFCNGNKIYSSAYIMPSPAFGNINKHRNHLRLIEHIMKSRVPKHVSKAKKLKEVFTILRSCPSFGSFLAFQFTIDLNYSPIIDFPENQFVAAGPGAKDGIKKCFMDISNFNEEDVIYAVAEMAMNEFDRLGLSFQTLWGRPLQPIDCQNLFCEVGKYSRVMHPEYRGDSGRVRIKQKFTPNTEPLLQWYPPKWNLKIPKNITKSSISSID